MDMGLVTSGQIEWAAEAQKRSNEDQRIGMYLVARGFITEAQLKRAGQVQQGLRSRDRCRKALAQADIAEESGASVTRLASHVRKRLGEVRRKTGSGYPAVLVSGSKKAE